MLLFKVWGGGRVILHFVGFLSILLIKKNIKTNCLPFFFYLLFYLNEHLIPYKPLLNWQTKVWLKSGVFCSLSLYLSFAHQLHLILSESSVKLREFFPAESSVLCLVVLFWSLSRVHPSGWSDAVLQETFALNVRLLPSLYWISSHR